MNTPQNIPTSLHQASDPWAVPTPTSLALLAAGPTEVKPATTCLDSCCNNATPCPICGKDQCAPGAIHR
jgi:hypothetical protein